VADPAGQVVARLAGLREHLAVAESLTGGALCSAIVGVPGASVVLRGGVVAYASDLKASLLGVDRQLLARHGAVHPEVAEQMALGVIDRLTAEHGLATTGVAGPDPQDGAPVGRVYVAHAGPKDVEVVLLDCTGHRAAIRARAVAEALELLLRRLA